MPVLIALPFIVILVLIAALPAMAAGDAVHHAVNARLLPAEHRIEVVDVVEGLEPGARAAFDIARSVEVRARVGGRDAPVTRDGERRIVEMPAAATRLSLEYTVALPSETQADGPFLNEEHGFLPGWASWLPAFGARESFDVNVEVSAPLRALATGSLVEETAADGSHRARTQLPPGSEPPSLFAGRFVTAEREVDGIRLRTWFTEATAALATTYLDHAATYLARYEALIGDHPYDSFTVVAAPIPVGLGFPGLTYVSERILPLPFMQTRSLAHEILHGWWGNAVRIAYGQGNWAEGLTTYMADYGILDEPAAEAAMRLEWLRDYQALPESADTALVDFAARSHDASQVVGYNKAAMVFHMLRRQVGDEAFQRALRAFYQEHHFERAAWRDLQASFEAATGEDLELFFTQWLERPGAPSLRLSEARRNDGEVRVTIAQDAPAYHLEVPVRIETAVGSEDLIVALSGGRTSARLQAAATPLALAVDPDHHLFRRLAPGEAPPIIRDVTLDPGAHVVLAVPEGSRETAGDLAGRLLGEDAAEAQKQGFDGSKLIIAVGDKAEAFEPAPPQLRGRGTARVWTGAIDGGVAMIVEADDAAALDALLRPLPHYRRDSWLVFEGDRAIDRGVWPGGTSVLRKSLVGP
jgi:aminopeptidase N